jgi:hypothetical protein
MLRNILQKIRSKYRQEVQDTTKEWEETGEKQEVYMTNVLVEVKLPFWKRVKFLFTGKQTYQLTENQLNRIIIRATLWR